MGQGGTKVRRRRCGVGAELRAQGATFYFDRRSIEDNRTARFSGSRITNILCKFTGETQFPVDDQFDGGNTVVVFGC